MGGAVVTIARRVDPQVSLVASEREGQMDAAIEMEEVLDGVMANDGVPAGHVDASAKGVEDLEAFTENDWLANVAMVDPSEVDSANVSSLVEAPIYMCSSIELNLCP